MGFSFMVDFCFSFPNFPNVGHLLWVIGWWLVRCFFGKNGTPHAAQSAFQLMNPPFMSFNVLMPLKQELLGMKLSMAFELGYWKLTLTPKLLVALCPSFVQGAHIPSIFYHTDLASWPPLTKTRLFFNLSWVGCPLVGPLPKPPTGPLGIASAHPLIGKPTYASSSSSFPTLCGCSATNKSRLLWKQPSSPNKPSIKSLPKASKI